MDQRKIGEFLKELRTERQWTQAALADQIGVSNRSISRWENGTTLPDLSLLVMLSELYSVSIEEILDGRKKESEMNNNQTITKVADYTTNMEDKRAKRMMWFFIVALLAMGGYAIIDINHLGNIEPYESIASMLLGFIFGTLMVGVLYCSKTLQNIARTKLRLKSFILQNDTIKK